MAHLPSKADLPPWIRFDGEDCRIYLSNKHPPLIADHPDTKHGDIIYDVREMVRLAARGADTEAHIYADTHFYVVIQEGDDEKRVERYLHGIPPATVINRIQNPLKFYEYDEHNIAFPRFVTGFYLEPGHHRDLLTTMAGGRPYLSNRPVFYNGREGTAIIVIDADVVPGAWQIPPGVRLSENTPDEYLV